MMLRLWSQVARPQLSCNCIACSSSVTGVLARRTASATTRRRLKLVDAFTILLAPVLATAFVADINWKDRRRIEWDRKIAEVEGEVERLRRQESQILRSLNTRINPRRKRPHHVRSYSTDVRLRVLEDDTNGDVQLQRWRSKESNVEDNDDSYQMSARHAPELFNTNSKVTEDAKKAIRRIEKLVALKFAMRMVVHVSVGPSPRFKDDNPGYTHNSRKAPGDLNYLVNQLHVVRQSLHELNAANSRPNVSAFEKMPRNEQAVIDLEIRQTAHEFQLGKLSVRDFVTRISNSIIRSPEPPSLKAYVPLMMVFSRARLDELTYLVIAAIDEARLTISNNSLVKIIWQYGKNRDTHRFDTLLKSITKADAATKYTETWEWRIVNQVEVPCPKSNDSRLLQILVYTALKCDQPHRAEAWASQLKYSDSLAKYTSHVLRNFMKFFSTHRDWQRGQAWMSAALDWSISKGPDVIRDLQRVVFAMLELCVACGKQAAYSCILQAAVQARVGIFSADADLKFTERSKSILAEWDKLNNSEPTCVKDDHLSPQSKSQSFHAAVTPKLEALGLTKGPQFEWPSPKSVNFTSPDKGSENSSSTDQSTSALRDLCERQAVELGKVKARLAEMKWLFSRNPRSNTEEQGSQTLLSPPAYAKKSEVPLLSVSVDSATIRHPEHPVPPSSRMQIQPLRSSKLSTVMSQVSQETNTDGSDVGQPDSDLDQKWAAISAQVAESNISRSKASGSDDLIKASHSSRIQLQPDVNYACASAQGSSMHENIKTSSHVEDFPYPRIGLAADSVRHNSLSEVRPLAGEMTNLGRETEHFQKGNSNDFHGHESDTPNKQTLRPPTPSLEVASPRLNRSGNDEPEMHAAAPDTRSTAGVPRDAAELQPTETFNHSRKGQWLSLLNMPRTRQLSAHATLRYIHLQSPQTPGAVKQQRPEGLKYKDKKPSSAVRVHLGHLPRPYFVKFVNGEFKAQACGTENTQAYAAKMKLRPVEQR